MDKPSVITVDTFSKRPDKRKILLCYMIHGGASSTRLTVACCGLKHILLYADEKRIKFFKLPEEIACATVVNASAQQEGKAATKVLLCGSTNGSVFALILPSDKESLGLLKKGSPDRTVTSQGVKREFTSVHKYVNLRITSLSCIDGHLIALGRDEEGCMQLLLFQPNALHDALSILQSEHPSTSTTNAFENISVKPPTLCEGDPRLLIFHSNGSYSGKSFTSLDNIHYLHLELYTALFGMETGDSNMPIVCFFYPNGEIWYCLALDSECRKKSRFYRLASVHEACTAVATVLIDPEFLEQRLGCVPFTTPKMGVVVFGSERGASIIHATGELQHMTKPGFETVFVPYASEVKSFVAKKNGMVQCCDVFLGGMNSFARGVNLMLLCTMFDGDQHIGLRSERNWAFLDYNNCTALMSFKLSQLWVEHTFSPSSEGNIKALLSELKDLDLQSTDLRRKSEAVTDLLKNLNGLTRCLIDKKLDFFHFDISSSILECSNSKKLCVSIKITSTDKSPLLEAFSYNIEVSAKCPNKLVGYTHTFLWDADTADGQSKTFCLLMDEEDFECDGVVKINAFFNLRSYRSADSIPCDIDRYLESKFPILMHVFSKFLKVSTLA